MASNTIKTRIKRKQRSKPHKANLKADERRMRSNLEVLRKAAAEEDE